MRLGRRGLKFFYVTRQAKLVVLPHLYLFPTKPTKGIARTIIVVGPPAVSRSRVLCRGTSPMSFRLSTVPSTLVVAARNVNHIQPVWSKTQTVLQLLVFFITQYKMHGLSGSVQQTAFFHARHRRHDSDVEFGRSSQTQCPQECQAFSLLTGLRA